MTRTLAKRFWEKVDKRGPDDCWEWLGARRHRGRGYGSIRCEGTVMRAHRVAWRLIHGDVPKDKCVCHTCDNESCVNPAHLFLGTHRDNMRDMMQKGRDCHPTGEDLPQSKLTVEGVAQIRRRYSEGDVTQRELAHEYGVTQGAISCVITRRTW